MPYTSMYSLSVLITLLYIVTSQGRPGNVQTLEPRKASPHPVPTSPIPAWLTWPISWEVVLLMVLYSLTMERAWHVRRTLMLCTRAQRSWASFCPILRSSVLMTQPRFRSRCRGSPGLGPPARITSLCVSSSKLMGFACKTHMHSHSVMSFRSPIQRWTESTCMKCSLQPGNSGRVTADTPPLQEKSHPGSPVFTEHLV